jgi:hypothetical protein
VWLQPEPLQQKISSVLAVQFRGEDKPWIKVFAGTAREKSFKACLPTQSLILAWRRGAVDIAFAQQEDPGSIPARI